MNRKNIFLAMLPSWSTHEPPIGIAYLTAYLERSGYRVEQKDFNNEIYNAVAVKDKYVFDEYYLKHWTEENFIEKTLPVIQPFIEGWARCIAEHEAEIIGFTALSSNILTIKILIKRIKELNSRKIIILGGPYITDECEGEVEIIRDSSVDFIVPGEGETVLKELVDALNNNVDLKTVKGIVYKENGSIVDTGKRPLVRDLNELPFPSFEGFDMKKYAGLSVPICGSRGCINRCSFCSDTMLWERFRYRDGENIFNEVSRRIATYGNNLYFSFIDCLINGNIKELEIFCDLMIKNHIRQRHNVFWGGKATIRKEMTEDLLHKMHDAGCVVLHYGLESGSSKVLSAMNKRISVVLATDILRNTYNSGIFSDLFFILGFPTESEENFIETKNFVKDNARYINTVISGAGCNIYKGTDLDMNKEKYGIRFENGEWYSEFSTPEIRERRVREFIEHCRENDIYVRI